MKFHEQNEAQLTLQGKSLMLMLTKTPKSIHSKGI
jgi:hypothetical protein